MADKQAETPATQPTDPNVMASMAEMIGQAVAKGIASTQRKKVAFGEYDPKTSAHPNKATAEKFLPNRHYFQGGTPLNWEVISDGEVKLLNQIHRPGRYIDRFVEVTITEDGLDEVVNISWPYAKVDDRMRQGTKFSSFLHALQLIVAEQAAKDKEDEDVELERATRPRRKFGDTKAMREAMERAGA